MSAIAPAILGPMSVDNLHETLVERVEIASGKLVTLLHDTVADAAGEHHLREVVVHRGGVAVVPLLDDGRVLLVRQFRHAVGEVCLEIPAGTLDRLDDGSIESPDEAIRRELAEETGHSARGWRRFGRFFTAPGFATEVMHLYLATGLEPIEGYDGPEADERLEVVAVTLSDVLRMADEGELRDAKTLVGLYWVGRLAERGELEAR